MIRYKEATTDPAEIQRRVEIAGAAMRDQRVPLTFEPKMPTYETMPSGEPTGDVLAAVKREQAARIRLDKRLSAKLQKHKGVRSAADALKTALKNGDPDEINAASAANIAAVIAAAESEIKKGDKLAAGHAIEVDTAVQALDAAMAALDFLRSDGSSLALIIAEAKRSGGQLTDAQANLLVEAASIEGPFRAPARALARLRGADGQLGGKPSTMAEAIGL